ncbi:MAG: lipoyl(octanoyl) transferase LipB [Veillonellales bacterium]
MKQVCLLNLKRIPYPAAWEMQLKMVAQRRKGEIEDSLILLEHDPVFTVGRAGSHTNIKVDDSVLKAENISVYDVDRGGDVTYHGPGQVVCYPILDLTKHGRDMHRYVRQLEEVIIRAVSEYGIEGFREKGLTGVWTEQGKIAAIGVGVKGWVSMHGFALNVHPNMQHFSMINPCGITDRPVASMEYFGVTVSRDEICRQVIEKFAEVFEVKIVPVRSGENGSSKA